MRCICYTRIHEIVRCIRFSSRKWGDQHECLWGIVVNDCVCNINRAGYFSSLILIFNWKKPHTKRYTAFFKVQNIEESRCAPIGLSLFLFYHSFSKKGSNRQAPSGLRKRPVSQVPVEIPALSYFNISDKPMNVKLAGGWLLRTRETMNRFRIIKRQKDGWICHFMSEKGYNIYSK